MCVLSEVDVAIITVCVCVRVRVRVRVRAFVRACVRVCMCVCDSLFFFSFFLLSLFVTMYIFLTAMYSSTFGKGWVGRSCLYLLVCSPLVVLACESLHVCTVYIWRCEHARFCVEVCFLRYI